MANCYRMIQMTNNAIPAVAANELLPLGTVTRRVCPRSCGCQTFELSYTGADTVTINEAGYYRVAYTLSGAAGATDQRPGFASGAEPGPAGSGVAA